MDDSQAIPSPSLVVLVGAPASGKSTWAADHFAPPQILCADTLRGIVGEHELDLSATDDAFDLLDRMLEMRLGRRLTTVIDTTGLDDARRAGYLATARTYGITAVAVRFPTSGAECKRRNRERAHPVPVKALDTMLRRFRTVAPTLDDEGWDLVLEPTTVRVVTKKLTAAADKDAPTRSADLGATLRFGLHVSDFEWIGDKADASASIAELARQAEAAGFESLWLMDHLIQIPQVGREWDAMFEPYTTLAYMAAATERIRLGVLVSPVTFRHVALLAKLVATLDVLSGGRAVAGIGAGSSEAEHTAFGLPFGPPAERLELLEETLRALPVIWGSGSKSFEGRSISIERAIGYPRPLQDPMPIIVGGSGEQRTLKLAAQYGSGCNVFGDLATVERRIELVRGYLDAAGRADEPFEITHLGGVLLGSDQRDLAARIEAGRPSNMGPERFASRANAGTLDDHEAAFAAMRNVGVHTAIVSTRGLDDPSVLDIWADLIGRF